MSLAPVAEGPVIDTVPRPGQRGKKVCIVGFAKPHRDEAPYADPEWEIWAVNDYWSVAKRADRWFEVHSPWIYEWELRRAKGHLDWLRSFGEQGGLVYLLEARPDMPKAVRFPFEAVVGNLWPELATEGNHKTARPYLTSSIAYAQALAIAEGFKEIAIVGVDMAADSEYADQKPCCEYLLGLAKGRGIKIWLPENCGLLSGPLYGRGWMNEGGERISTDQLQHRLMRLQQHEAQAVANCDQVLGLCQQIQGAIVNTREWLAELAGQPQMAQQVKARLDDLERQMGEAQQKRAQHMDALNQVRGALTECKYWIGLTPHGGDARLLPPVLVAPVKALSAPATEPPTEGGIPVPPEIAAPLIEAAEQGKVIEGRRRPAKRLGPDAPPPLEVPCSTVGCPAELHGPGGGHIVQNGDATEALEVPA